MDFKNINFEIPFPESDHAEFESDVLPYEKTLQVAQETDKIHNDIKENKI